LQARAGAAALNVSLRPARTVVYARPYGARGAQDQSGNWVAGF
jgi:hypothetical protein